MKKYIFPLLLIVILGLLLCSCSRDIHSGKYIVERVNGRLIEFKGVNNYYVVDNDTVKVGDTLKLRRTFKQSKATIY